MKRHITRCVLLSIVLAFFMHLTLRAEEIKDPTAPLNGIYTFTSPAAASDTLRVDAVRPHGDVTILPQVATMIQGHDNSHITVDKTGGSGPGVIVATVVNRAGDSLYRVTGFEQRGGGGGATERTVWNAGYNSGDLPRLHMEVNSHKSDDNFVRLGANGGTLRVTLLGATTVLHDVQLSAQPGDKLSGLPPTIEVRGLGKEDNFKPLLHKPIFTTVPLNGLDIGEDKITATATVEGQQLTASIDVEVVSMFLDNGNTMISNKLDALNVSNYVPTESLPNRAATTFGAVCDDPSNFRLEARCTRGLNSVEVELQVIRDENTVVGPMKIELTHRDGNRYRSDFLRLVSDTVDQGGSSQRILVKLGDTLKITQAVPGKTFVDTMSVGRPASENDNGPNQLRHDIRELKLNVVVFSRHETVTLGEDIDAEPRERIKVSTVGGIHPSGVIKIGNEVIAYDGVDPITNEFTGITRGTPAASHDAGAVVLCSGTIPAVTRNMVIGDLNRIEERYAQATIRLKGGVDNVPINMGPNNHGVPLPGAMLDGYTPSWPLNDANDDERAIVTYKDEDSNSIDIFYVRGPITRPGRTYGGWAYTQKYNLTGDNAFHNFTVISHTGGPFITAHEIMHILLNEVHIPERDDEPRTALFNPDLSGSNTIDATKRIGPYPASDATGVGHDDTFVIRGNVETLP